MQSQRGAYDVAQDTRRSKASGGEWLVIHARAYDPQPGLRQLASRGARQAQGV